MVTSKVTKTTTTEMGIDIKTKDIVELVMPTIEKVFGGGKPRPHIEVSIMWNTNRAGSEPEADDVIIHVRAILVANE